MSESAPGGGGLSSGWATILRQEVLVDASSFAKWLIVAGLALAAVGALVWLAGKTGLPIGSLPGDIRVERPGFSFRFPVVTCIAVSIILTVIINVVLRIFRR